MKKRVILISSIAAGALLVTGLAIFLGISIPEQNRKEEIYKKANEHLYRYELDESEELFNSIYGYRDSVAKIGVIHGVKTLNEGGSYNKAIDVTTAKGGVIEVSFTSEGTPVDPIIITEKTVIDAKSYMEHYDFLKWNILSYHLIEDSHSFQLNLYSSFTPHVYSIDYDVGEGFVIDPVRSYKYGTSVTATNAYCDGHTFIGYTVGDSEELHNPFVVKETDGENFLLTAHYTPNPYTYQFDAMGGTAPMEEGTYTYGQEYLIPSASREGYQFLGWYTEYGKKLENKINIDENVTLYAHYTPITYQINYELRGGKFLESAPTGYDIESEDLAIPYPNRAGYLFLGWVVADQTANYSDVNYVIKTGSKGNLTLHACWRQYESDHGNSYLKSLGDFDLPDVGPCGSDDYVPGYVIPYNITSIKGDIFGDSLIHSFGVGKKNSVFDVIGDKNQYLVNKDHTAIYKMAFTDRTTIDLQLMSSITDIKEYAFAHAPLKSITSENVVNLSEGAFANSSIESTSLPNVTRFEEKAFMDCHNLTNMNDSLLNVTYIGDYCFHNTHLASVTVGDDISYFGPHSFGGSEDYHFLSSFECLSTQFDTMKDVFSGQTGNISLKLAKVVDSVKSMFGSTNVHLDVVDLVGVTDIPDEFLYEIPTFTELNNTVDVLTIGDRAFFKTEARLIPSLTKVRHIGESAFEQCADLGDVVLEDIEYIGEHAFKDSGLKSINLPESITYIGDGVFEGCEDLEKIVLYSPFQLNTIGNINRLFGENTFCTKLDIEVRGEGTLPERAFQNLYVGKSVTLGATVNLSQFAFNNATSIQNVYFDHDRNEIIPIGCFENACSLVEIDITNIKAIYAFAYNNCTSALKIVDLNGEENTLNAPLHIVGNQAFGNLMKIPTIDIKNPAIEFGEAVFANDTFDIGLYNDITLSMETLKDFQGSTWIMH